MTLPKKYEVTANVVQQQKLIETVYFLMVYAPAIAQAAEPGQFVQLRILRGAFTLRRPLGVAAIDRENGNIAFIYRVVGEGTRALAALQKDDSVNVLGPLGNGFSHDFVHPLVVGGGMGLSPLLYYAASLKGRADVLMGGRTEDELFWNTLFHGFVRNIFITTDDGSLGVRGFVTDLLPTLLARYDYDGIVVCGPEVMMRGVAKLAQEHGTPCEVSLEARMACGLGACLSCSVDTRGGRRKVCKDGPVFSAAEVFS